MNIADFFNQNCKNQHIEPDTGLWDRLEQTLDNPKPHTQKPIEMSQQATNANAQTGFLSFKTIGIAAAVVVILATSIFIIVNTNTDSTSAPLATNTPEQTPPLQNNKMETPVVVDSTKLGGGENTLTTPNSTPATKPEQIANAKEKTLIASSKPSKSGSSSTNTDSKNLTAQKPSESNSTVSTIANEEKSIGASFLGSARTESTPKSSKKPTGEIEQASAGSEIASTDNNVTAFPLSIPNAITPNNDGINDTWIIRGLENYSSNHILVVDRNGRKVFENKNYQNNWNGSNLEPGNYFYTIKLIKDGRETVKNGLIMIVK